jgi:hypothetical protein
MVNASTNLVFREIITVPRGTTKRLEFVFIDKPDLSNADIKFIVIDNFNDKNVIINKSIDYDSDSVSQLNEGIFFITIEPQDTQNLKPFTYYYFVRIIRGNEILEPIKGEFIVTETAPI